MTQLVTQGELTPTLLALAARDGLTNIDDNLSSVSSSSSLPSLSKNDSNKTTTQACPNLPQEDQGKVFLETFIDIGTSHGLQPDSHPINILKEALKELSKDNPSQEGSARRCIAHNSLVPPSFTVQLREFVFDEIPVFNIWDSIALIYSTSIERIHSDREVELFLYQLRLILLCM